MLVDFIILREVQTGSFCSGGGGHDQSLAGAQNLKLRHWPSDINPIASRPN